MTEELYITRRRKKYKFAKFNELSNCFQLENWNSELIDSDKKLVVEIGAGSALFLVELAKLHPENFYIAVDIKSDRLYRGARQADELKLTNIVFVRSDIWHICDILPGDTVDEIWLTFSDPYPRKSDARHRLTAVRFQELYKKILKPDGLLHFKTDNQPLFDWSLEQFADNGWTTGNMSRDLHESDLSDEYKNMTSYEQKFSNEGLPIYYSDFSYKA